MRKILLIIIASLAACGGTSTAPDGGAKRDGGADAGLAGDPVVSISASPTQGMINQPVTFTAAVSGGTPPYRTCGWRFSGGAEFEAGALSGASCTGTHTYTMDQDPVVISIEIGDNANHIGRADFAYTVGGTTSATGIDYVVRDIVLTSPPTNNRYTPGDPLRIAFKIRNSGLGAGGASTARVSLRDFGRTETVLGTVNVPGVAMTSDQLATATFNIPVGQTIGSYDLKVEADVDQQVDELDETNNITLLLGALKVETTASDGGM